MKEEFMVTLTISRSDCERLYEVARKMLKRCEGNPSIKPTAIARLGAWRRITVFLKDAVYYNKEDAKQ